MPRSPSRPTLKLPAKTATTNETADPRPPSRKPARAGFKAPKPSAAQHASNVAAREARLASEAKKTFKSDEKPRTPRLTPDVLSKPIPNVEKPESPARRQEKPAPREVRAPEQPKVYPKRGIARSTGARALPPARPRREDDAPRPNPNRRDVAPRPTPLLPAISPRKETPPTPLAAEPSTKKRRPLTEPPRLSKRLREITQCSRRESDEWIENGWVSVDGVVVTTLGTRAHPNAKIEIRDEASAHQTESVTILFNKPLNLSPEATLPLIRPETRWLEDTTPFTFKATHLRGLALAGQLDADSTGMLVFTQEGSVARRIAGNDTRLEKEYMVDVEGELSPEDLKRLNYGLTLDDIKLKRAQVSWQHEQQLRFVLHESRKQQIRRMCELIGLRVTSIKRLRIGSVSLGKLPEGKWRYLRENERF